MYGNTGTQFIKCYVLFVRISNSFHMITVSALLHSFNRICVFHSLNFCFLYQFWRNFISLCPTNIINIFTLSRHLPHPHFFWHIQYYLFRSYDVVLHLFKGRSWSEGQKFYVYHAFVYTTCVCLLCKQAI